MARLRQLADGQWLELYQEFLTAVEAKEAQRAARTSTKDPRQKALKTVKKLTRLGRTGDAAERLLSQDAVAPHSEETLQGLRKLFPSAEASQCDELEALGSRHALSEAELEELEVRITPTLVRGCLQRFKKAAGCGQDGLSADMLKVLAQDPNVIEVLTKIVRCGARGLTNFPQEYQDWYTGGVLFALVKPNLTLRPIVCGLTLRRLVARCLAAAVKDEVSAVFKQQGQFGVGVSNGAEGIIHTMREWMTINKLTPNIGLLKIDFRNAFNLINRPTILSWLSQFSPSLLPYANLVLSRSNPLFFGSYDLSCDIGTQQGDPLAPLFFSGGMSQVIEAILASQLKEVSARLDFKLWYLDDGTMACSPADAALIMEALTSNAATQGGLFLRPDKCEYYHSDATNVPPGLLKSVTVVPFSESFIMGAPLGSTPFVSQFLTCQASIDVGPTPLP
jgi:hypothetical protein